MESTCHKRVVIRCITEYNQFCTAQRIVFFCSLCGGKNHLTHQFYSIHVDTGLCGSQVYGAADTLGFCKSLRDGTDQQLICFCHPFGYQCRITTDKVYAYFFCCFIQCFCQCDKVFRCFTCCTADQCDRGNGDSFIYNRDSVFFGDIFTGLYQIFCQSCDLFINLLIDFFQITVDTV